MPRGPRVRRIRRMAQQTARAPLPETLEGRVRGRTVRERGRPHHCAGGGNRRFEGQAPAKAGGFRELQEKDDPGAGGVLALCQCRAPHRHHRAHRRLREGNTLGRRIAGLSRLSPGREHDRKAACRAAGKPLGPEEVLFRRGGVRPQPARSGPPRRRTRRQQAHRGGGLPERLLPSRARAAAGPREGHGAGRRPVTRGCSGAGTVEEARGSRSRWK